MKKNNVNEIIKNKNILGVLLLLFVILTIVLILILQNKTLAYFAAGVESTGDEIKGASLQLSLELTVNEISDNATGNLIPLDNDVESLNNAIKGYNNNTNIFDNTKSCIDKNGYSVCKVYEIKVKNKGSGGSKIDGGLISLLGDKTPNVACAVMKDSLTVKNNESCIGTDTIASQDVIGGNQTLTYYIVVYINNLDEPQLDVGLFEGTVEFTAQAGVKIDEKIN